MDKRVLISASWYKSLFTHFAYAIELALPYVIFGGFMKIAAALIYWVIVAVWLAVLTIVVVFYLRKVRTFGTTRMLLAVIAIDTLQTIIENTYFGIYFNAQYGFLPNALIGALGKPALVILPKIMNVISGCLVLSILLLRWLPEAVIERNLLERDVSVQRELATVDSLTGLFNRRHFLAAAEVERQRFQRHRRPLSMLMVDIDQFKSINDCFGHDVGDEVIEAVADVLRGETRGTDVSARLGGEEFGMLLPETSLENAGMVAERLREAVSKITLFRAAGPVTPTVSVGVSEATAGMPISDLMKEADCALYEAKQGGRNKICKFDRLEIRTES